MGTDHTDLDQRQVELLEDLLISLQHTSRDTLQLRVGMFKSAWYEEFEDERIPSIISLIIDTIIKKANSK